MRLMYEGLDCVVLKFVKRVAIESSTEVGEYRFSVYCLK